MYHIFHPSQPSSFAGFLVPIRPCGRLMFEINMELSNVKKKRTLTKLWAWAMQPSIHDWLPYSSN